MYVKDFGLLIYMSRDGYEPIKLEFTAEFVNAGATGRRPRGARGGQGEEARAAGSNNYADSGLAEYSCTGNMFDHSARFDWAVRVGTCLWRSSALMYSAGSGPRLNREHRLRKSDRLLLLLIAMTCV